MSEQQVVLPKTPTPAALEALARKHLTAYTDVFYAVITHQHRVRALYLSAWLRQDVGWCTRSKLSTQGAFLTGAALPTSPPVGRVAFGPNYLLCQMDVPSDYSFVAPWLMRFEQRVPLIQHTWAGHPVAECMHHGQRYLLTAPGARLRVYGIGDLSSTVVQDTIAQVDGDSLTDYLGSLGAIRLNLRH